MGRTSSHPGGSFARFARLPNWLDLLYPRTCAGCGAAVGEEAHCLCWDCRSELLLVRPPFCRLCGDPVEGRVDHEFICYHCASVPIHFELARSAARYDGVLRRTLQAYKYEGAMWLRRDLLDLLEPCFRMHYRAGDVDAVCAVPMHPTRRRRRGYNHAHHLAAGLAARLGKPLLRGAAFRIRPTPTQTNLTASERASNVRGAFMGGTAKKLRGRRLLLVDDVMTTGSTANACAGALKQGGALSVNVLTVARG